MQDSTPPPPSSDGAATSNGSYASTPPPAVHDGVEGLDPKMTVMGGGEKEKAADYANCEITTQQTTYRETPLACVEVSLGSMR